MNEDVLDAIAKAKALEQELKEVWLHVFLKSGQSFLVKAENWEVLREDYKEGDPDNDAFIAVTEDLVVFYNEEGECENEIYLPFSEVACIRQLDPITLARDDFDEG